MKKTKIPDDTFLLAKIEDLYYADYYEIIIKNNQLSCLDIYKIMTDVPLYIKLLFKLRDLITKPLGIKKINGFKKNNICKIESGNKIDFFDVKHYDDSLMILTIFDTHLNVMICLKIDSNDRGKIFSLASSVKIHNKIGKYYMNMIIPFHKFIIKLMFKNLTNFLEEKNER